MTEFQWQREEIRLKRAVTLARNRALEARSLADKLAAQAETKRREEFLHAHRLHKFSLLEAL